jgi:hypothetical protein
VCSNRQMSLKIQIVEQKIASPFQFKSSQFDEQAEL